jgi:hypothetical protein
LKTFVQKRTASIAAQLAGKSKGYVPRGFGFGPPGGGPGFGRPSRPINEPTFRTIVKAPEGFDMSLFAAPPKVSYPVALAAAPSGELFVAVDEQGSIGRPRRGPARGVPGQRRGRDFRPAPRALGFSTGENVVDGAVVVDQHAAE